MAETAHKHAHLMAAYAADALETDRPWERWEVSALENAEWINAIRGDMDFGYWQYYRRKPDAPAIPWHLLREVVENE